MQYRKFGIILGSIKTENLADAYLYILPLAFTVERNYYNLKFRFAIHARRFGFKVVFSLPQKES